MRETGERPDRGIKSRSVRKILGLSDEPAVVDTMEYTYLTLPPVVELRSCVGLVVAGLAARARIGIGGLEEAVELLEQFHSMIEPTHYRFGLMEDGIIAEVAGGHEEDNGWRTVVELVS